MLVVVMVMLFVAAGLVALLLQRTLLESNRLKREQLALQADRLAEAGLRRGLAAHETNADYRGETWKAPLPGDEPATVVISLDENGRVLAAAAELVADDRQPVRSRRSIPLPNSP